MTVKYFKNSEEHIFIFDVLLLLLSLQLPAEKWRYPVPEDTLA